jgi:hypothetical protein
MRILIFDTETTGKIQKMNKYALQRYKNEVKYV